MLAVGAVRFVTVAANGWVANCDVSVTGAFVLVDLLAVKPSREALSIYGAQYGGPNFDEPSPPSQRLHVDEYFYSGTGADQLRNIIYFRAFAADGADPN